MSDDKEIAKQFHERIDGYIKEHGHAVICVHGLGAYTVGLSVRGFELFSPLASEITKSVFNALSFKDQVGPGDYTIDEFKVKDEDLRVRLVEITDPVQVDIVEDNLILAVKRRYSDVERKLFHVFMGDGNNLLPGETGYDDVGFGSFQTFSALEDNILTSKEPALYKYEVWYYEKGVEMTKSNLVLIHFWAEDSSHALDQLKNWDPNVTLSEIINTGIKYAPGSV